MVKFYTTKQILQYLYKELNEKEKSEFEAEMLCNKSLANKVNRFKSALNQIEQLSAEPSQTSIDIVLEYSMKQAKQKEFAD